MILERWKQLAIAPLLKILVHQHYMKINLCKFVRRGEELIGQRTPNSLSLEEKRTDDDDNFHIIHYIYNNIPTEQKGSRVVTTGRIMKRTTNLPVRVR